MKATDRIFLLVLPAVALVAAFWFLLLSPKRDEAATLGDEIAQAEAALAEQEERAAFAEQAREDYPRDYREVVVLGKAVPADDDTPSMLVGLNRIAATSGVQFQAFELQESEASATPPATPTPETPATAAVEQEQRAEVSEESTSPAPATESAAATLPIGATVGPAGLPVMPYRLEFRGDFYRVAEFVRGIDGLVSTRGGHLAVDGRLMTIDGFSLGRDPVNDFPSLTATFAVTTYLTPPDQGATAGATPAGPAPVSAPSSSTSSTPTTTASTVGSTP